MANLVAVISIASLSCYILAILCAPSASRQIYMVVPICKESAEMAIESAVRCVPYAEIIALDMGEGAGEIVDIMRRRYARLRVAKCDELAEIFGCKAAEVGHIHG